MWQTDPRCQRTGRATELTYDLAGQLIRRVGHSGVEELLTYSLRGDLVSTKSGTVEVSLERNALGRVVADQQRLGDETHGVSIRYDESGQRIERRTSLGHVEQVLRDASGNRVRSDIDGHLVEHAADLRGREVRRGFAQGGAIESAFDPLGRLLQRRVLRPTTGASGAAGEPAWVGAQRGDITAEKSFRYSWDGEIIEAVDAARGATEYRYDPVGHLLAMVPPVAQGVLAGGSNPLADPAELFRYDPTGNLYEDGPGAPQRVYGRGNRLLRSGDTDYEWDADGNLIAKHTRNAASGTDERWEYQWNDFGFMSAATGPDLHIEFEYDSFARRLEKRVYRRKAASIAALPMQDRGELVRKTRFVWDRDVLAHEIREELVSDAVGGKEPSVEERTYWFADKGFEPWAHREKRTDDVATESTGWFHYANDPVGTPERLVAEDGTVAAEYQRKAWGAMEVTPGAKATTPLRFQGQYADEETGLAYNRNRYYDPQVGRFSSTDLIGIFSDHNVFRWTGNPVNRIDELGLATHAGQGYQHWFEAQLPKSMYLSSDDAHFRESNRQLHERMSTDSRYRNCMENRYPGIGNHVAPGPRGGYSDDPPPGTTWHHHPDRPGCLQLVDHADHQTRHGVYHPTGVGGRNTWGGGSSRR